MNVLLERFELPAGLRSLLDNSPSVIIPDTKDMLYELIFGIDSVDQIAVSYDVGGGGQDGGRCGALQKRRRRQLHRGLHAPARPGLHAHRPTASPPTNPALRRCTAVRSTRSSRPRTTGWPVRS